MSSFQLCIRVSMFEIQLNLGERTNSIAPRDTPRGAWQEPLNRVIEAAIAANLADPERRLLLLTGIEPALVGSIRSYRRPADQLRADVECLASLVDGRPLKRWLVNASQLAAPPRRRLPPRRRPPKRLLPPKPPLPRKPKLPRKRR